jgi:8-amino-7-oxononanoate synthase
MKTSSCWKNWECNLWNRMPTEIRNSILEELGRDLRELDGKFQRRRLRRVAGVSLCSNDYLGLSEHTGLRELVAEAVRRAGQVGGTGSRLLSGQHAAWDEIENEFASFAGTETALYFGSGYAANLGLLTSLLGKEDLVFSDALNHASIIDAIRLSGARRVIYRHGDLNELEELLQRHEAERCRKIVVTESVFSMDGDVADVRAIVELAERFGASVIVDEAHATAVRGPEGRGIVAETGNTQRVLAMLHTCGKALASAGAFVCGSSVLKEHLINRARTFIFSTAMPPYMAEQIGAALRLERGMELERKELRRIAEEFADDLRRDGWDTSATSSQIIPVLVGTNEHALVAAEYLQAEGFAVRGIRPPTVEEGKSRLRLSLTSKIGWDELVRLRSSLSTWRARMDVHTAAGCA